MERINVWVVCDKKPILEGLCHFAYVIREARRGNEEGGYAFDRAAFAPGSCFPKFVGGRVVEEGMCPVAFRSGDGATKVFDSGPTRFAMGSIYTVEGDVAVRVPPSDTSRVRDTAGFEIRG